MVISFYKTVDGNIFVAFLGQHKKHLWKYEYMSFPACTVDMFNVKKLTSPEHHHTFTAKLRICDLWIRISSENNEKQ